ncbi:AAA family ATPase [Sphaerotilus sulfidivorans]
MPVVIAPRHAFPARHRLANPAAPALPRKKLPVGIQTLAKLRCQGCCYVDKSGLAINLIESGSYFFLSRPRRFGKSLLVDTFKELFEGHRALFERLAAATRWDWSRRYPVIRISFSNGMLKSRIHLTAHLESEARIDCHAID